MKNKISMASMVFYNNFACKMNYNSKQETNCTTPDKNQGMDTNSSDAKIQFKQKETLKIYFLNLF